MGPGSLPSPTPGRRLDTMGEKTNNREKYCFLCGGRLDKSGSCLQCGAKTTATPTPEGVNLEIRTPGGAVITTTMEV